MKKRYGVLYSCVSEYLQKSCVNFCNDTIDRKILFGIFGGMYHVPKEKRHELLRELISFKILIPIGKQKNLAYYKIN